MIKVLLAERTNMTRSALSALLDLESDIKVIADVASGDGVMSAALAFRPTVAVISVDLPRRDGLAVAIDLHAELPECRTLMVAVRGKPGLVRRALEINVNGLMLKDAPWTELVAAIRAVAAGKHVIDRALIKKAWDWAGPPLAVREVEVLRLIARGHDVTEVASMLVLSPGTVRNYLSNAVAGLGARNRVDAVRIAHEEGWL